MAKLKAGPFGLPIGRIGNTVFYVLNGQGVCRNIGEQNNPATPKQTANRAEMKLLMKVLKPLQKFIKQGFEHLAKGTVYNAFNLATSYNKHHALQGEYPNLSINYKELKLSSGTLPSAKDLQIIKSEGGLTIKWDGTHQWKGDQYDDLVMIALYHPEDHDASLFLNAGKRDQGECFVAITDENLLNGSIEAYICFKSADGSSISDSAYLGNVNGSYQEKIEVKVDEQYTELLAEVEKAKAVFLKQDAYFSETGLKRKTLKDVKKQYEVLKERLDNLPGKPV